MLKYVQTYQGLTLTLERGQTQTVSMIVFENKTVPYILQNSQQEVDTFILETGPNLT